MKFLLIFVRIAVGLGFLSAVADRFGLWGPPGQPGVAWGSWAAFEIYTHQLLFFVGEKTSAVLAIAATWLEAVLGLLLIIGAKTRTVARLSGVLLGLFGCAMTVALGVKAPFDYSVWTAAGACWLLAAVLERTPPTEDMLSLDSYLLRFKKRSK